MARERILRELSRLFEGGQRATLVSASGDFVIYFDVPVLDTPGSGTTDVIVPVPSGYPGTMIDLAGLPVGSPLITRVAGGSNCQGTLTIEDRQWHLASYHPHANGGGPPWDQMVHGFHTYFDHIVAWLGKLT
jgi:hypothetical protein